MTHIYLYSVMLKNIDNCIFIHFLSIYHLSYLSSCNVYFAKHNIPLLTHSNTTEVEVRHFITFL
jgi:hypothetical protein